jgi:hypothetical protein
MIQDNERWAAVYKAADGHKEYFLVEIKWENGEPKPYVVGDVNGLEFVGVLTREQFESLPPERPQAMVEAEEYQRKVLQERAEQQKARRESAAEMSMPQTVAQKKREIEQGLVAAERKAQIEAREQARNSAASQQVPGNGPLRPGRVWPGYGPAHR